MVKKIDSTSCFQRRPSWIFDRRHFWVLYDFPHVRLVPPVPNYRPFRSTGNGYRDIHDFQRKAMFCNGGHLGFRTTSKNNRVHHLGPTNMPAKFWYDRFLRSTVTVRKRSAGKYTKWLPAAILVFGPHPKTIGYLLEPQQKIPLQILGKSIN